MAGTVTDRDVGREVEALHQLATVVLNEHTNDHDLCAVCGCAFPCERAVLAEHNLAL
ncbi:MULTISPECIES: hypothetical protein [unclassified Streptomyces]|uniref:hypothetical protein n=1 Tax=unclassified Streptomyces TaxID=2593676 RepID=UPI0003784148|nr:MULTISPECIES: hypothetical protein [unclassified Streptomyces]